jgi:3-deoxy-manno-octulosonate cytidylyltransferase (CMP-KDO synthetase)
MSNKNIVIIPVRLGSWRFRDKPLTDILGMPMLEHAYRRSLLAKQVDEVLVAGCDEEIQIYCESKSIKYIQTSKECPTALDRVNEASRQIGGSEDSIIINVQGDEPAFHPTIIDNIIDKIKQNNFDNFNYVEKVADASDLTNKHRIKAVIGNSRLIYLTRNSVPSTVFDIEKKTTHYRQTCIIGFKNKALNEFSNLPKAVLEDIEGIDMLRLIENGIGINTAVSEFETFPVDVKEDVIKVIKFLKNDSHTKLYLGNPRL